MIDPHFLTALKAFAKSVTFYQIMSEIGCLRP